MRLGRTPQFDQLRRAVREHPSPATRTRDLTRLLLVALCACLALSGSPRAHQAPKPAARGSRPALPLAAARAQQQAPDGVGLLLQKIEQAIRAGDTAAYRDLVGAADGGLTITTFAQLVIRPGVTRASVRERDRAPLNGVAAGDGYRLMVDVFCEFGTRASLSTWRLDVVRRKTPGSADDWTIRADELISAFAALYNLALGPREYAAKNMVISAEDLELRLPDGAVYVAETENGPTALVLIGPGQMVFRPTPASERDQVRIFSGSDTVETNFTTAFVRVSPSALRGHIARGTVIERAVDPAHARTAAEVFRADNGKSFGVNLGDLADEPWSLVPSDSDFLAEVHTKRFGILTYARSMHQAEDISLFDRAKHRNISLYASAEKLARRGIFYDEDDDLDCDVLHYDIDASLDPRRETITGVARLTLKVRAETVNSLTFMLADSLVIDSINSREFGRVVFVRVIDQNRFLINLPKRLPKGTVLGLTVAYHGPISPQFIDREAIAAGQQDQEEERVDIPPEPSYLFSNQSYWYPQSEANSFATATVRVRVPSGYACVASGDPDAATADALARLPAAGTQFVFRALQPVRYLSVLVARLLPVRTTQVVTTGGETPDAGPDPVAPSGTVYRDIDLKSFASPRLRGRAPAMADRAADILRFYGSLIGDCPYPTLTLALVERELPGGHSPGYLAVVSQPVLSTRLEWRGDPTSFPQFPEFFLAHEIAHQWWGQAVGWKNYHEQWLSEGLAQYFAALYAERLRGKDVFNDMMRKMQEWAVKKSAEGPVYLGYRIGHVKRDPQLFRAVVYDKSAVVLRMLRRLIGDEAFARGLRRFYREWRFRKAGSDDLRRAFEAESHRSLTRFFERWIYESNIPRLKFSSRSETDASGRPLVVLRFEQAGELFDVPVTVTLEYEHGAAVDVVVAVTEAVTEVRVPLEGNLRRIEVNRDRAAIVKIDK